MGSLFLSYALAFINFAFLFTTAQARTFPADCTLLKAVISATYGRSLSSPPPSLVTTPQSKELRYINYGQKKDLPSPPPPPDPATPIIQQGSIPSPCAEEVTSCNNNKYISMVTDFRRPKVSPPPPPKQSPPPRHERSPPLAST